MGAVFKREIKSFFLTPLGYIYLGIFLFLSGFFFTMSIIPPDANTLPAANFTDTLGTMTFTLLFIIPILTMRLVSEERKNGTDLLLYTSPVSLTEVVLAKYLVALAEFTAGLLITLIYPLILSFFSKVDVYVLISGYIGYFLIGAVFISIGMFASSLTKSQIASAILCTCFLIVAWVLEGFKILLGLTGTAQKIFNNFVVITKYDDFAVGLFDYGSVIFFLSLIGVFIFLTYRTIEKRRWSEE